MGAPKAWGVLLAATVPVAVVMATAMALPPKHREREQQLDTEALAVVMAPGPLDHISQGGEDGEGGGLHSELGGMRANQQICLASERNRMPPPPPPSRFP